MSDEIREAFEKWCGDYFSGDEYDIQMSESAFEHGYHAGAASRDDEISELVDVINEMQLAISDPQVSYDEMVALSIKAKRIVSRYTKTPCPECGGSGDKSIGEDVTGNEMCYPCPTCKGSGKVWRKDEYKNRLFKR